MPGWVDGPIDDHKMESALGGGGEGTLAEEVALPETGLVRISERLSFEEAATLPCAGVTAWHSLFEAASVKPGDTVLTLGTGGVSVFAVQLASLAGARVIATSSSDDKLKRVHQLGATHLINYKTDPRLGEEGTRVDRRGRRRRRRRGRRRGDAPEIGPRRPDRRDDRVDRRAVGPGAGRSDLDPDAIDQGSRDLRRLGFDAQGDEPGHRRRRNQTRVDRVFPFENAPDALRHMESGSHFGKIVIRV